MESTVTGKQNSLFFDREKSSSLDIAGLFSVVASFCENSLLFPVIPCYSLFPLLDKHSGAQGKSTYSCQ